MRLEDKLYATKFKSDEGSHLWIISHDVCTVCERRQCLYTCPANCYTAENSRIVVAYEGCVECGTCRIICPNIGWRYPKGGYGVIYRYG